MLVRCSCCAMPNTRPDTPFLHGVCAACINYAKRPEVDWEWRRGQLLELLDRHHGRVLVPSSGGKDSTYQALTLKELGADVTVVTARTCHLTPVGRANIDNLARHCRTIEVVPNMTVRAKLNRLGLEMVGDISWPEHAVIFSTPFRVAVQTGHTLLMYGENPQDQYGGPMGTEQALQMTRRWVTEFGGFLGLRPDDFVGIEGITERDMDDYRMPSQLAIDTTGLGRGRAGGIEAHFLGQYIPWDSKRNAEVATIFGMRTLGKAPCKANWWEAENLDNAQTGLHDYFMWLKYGFGRGCQQISVDVRAGHVAREDAIAWCETFDGIFPHTYAGVDNDEVVARIGVTREHLERLIAQFRNPEVHGAA